MKINRASALRLWDERYGDQRFAVDFHGSLPCTNIATNEAAENGVVWDSDFILNFKEMRLAIQPDRANILEDILEHNTYYHLKEERKQRRKRIPIHLTQPLTRF